MRLHAGGILYYFVTYFLFLAVFLFGGGWVGWKGGKHFLCTLVAKAKSKQQNTPKSAKKMHLLWGRKTIINLNES